MGQIFKGYHTESAGTAIVEVIPPVDDYIPIVDRIQYTAAGTEHTLTALKCVGATMLTATTVASASTMEVTVPDPVNGEALAANDYVVYYDEKGIYQVTTVSSVSGTTLTLSAAVTNDVRKGTWLYAFYEVGRATHDQIKLTASTTTSFEGRLVGGYSLQRGTETTRSGEGDPMLIHVDNATNAGTLHWVSGYYLGKTDMITT